MSGKLTKTKSEAFC